MGNISGLITGSLGVQVKRDFLANAIAFRDVSTYSFSIYSVDFTGSASVIQSQIQQQFSQVYSGDVHCTAFQTQNTYAFPSDSLKSSRFDVVVEIKSPVYNLASGFPELTTPYYSGLDTGFFFNYGQYILDFKEDFGFTTNSNGNREFNHSVGFGIQTGFSGDNSMTGRKAFAQTIISGIFAGDSETTFGLYTMLGQISGVGNSGLYRNYFTESYDLFQNKYSFSRTRKELPFDDVNTIYNLSYSVEMGTNGIINVSEKADTEGKINFSLAESGLETYLIGAYSRCSGIYGNFYNTNVLAQDQQYSILDGSGLLPLINTPVKISKIYDANGLKANYTVEFTNNPNFSGDGTITSQTIETKINTYNVVDISHTFDYTVNRITNNSGYFTTLMSGTTGSSPATIETYYNTNFSDIAAIYPNLNLVKESFDWPNIKTKGSSKFDYSNSPMYFVNINGITFNVLDVAVSDGKPNDVVNEFKVVNRPTKNSVLSYAYQSERGKITISIKAQLPKSTNQFYPDGVGSFATIGGITLGTYIQALYKFGGTVFLQQFPSPLLAMNWFLANGKYSFDSEGKLNIGLEYAYTYKKRLSQNFP